MGVVFTKESENIFVITISDIFKFNDLITAQDKFLEQLDHN